MGVGRHSVRVTTHHLLHQGDQQKTAIYVNEDKTGDSAHSYRRTDSMCQRGQLHHRGRVNGRCACKK